jgi:hypothetical protein
MCRQRIEAADSFAVGRKNEYGGQLPFLILPRLSL